MTSTPEEPRDFSSIGVIGLGTMGAGIAEVFARNGFAVTGVEINDEALERGRQHLEHSTGRAVARGKLTEAEQVDGSDRGRELPPHQRHPRSQRGRMVGEQLLQVPLHAVLLQAGVDAELVRGVVLDVLDEDAQRVPVLAGHRPLDDAVL